MLLRLDRRRVPHLLATAMLISTALISVKYGAMLPNDHFRAGWNRLSRRLNTERYAYVQELVEKIPEDAVVCATSALGPHVSSRDTSRKWPACRESTYALLSTGRFKKRDKNRIKRQVRQGRLTLIDEDHGIGLYARTPKSKSRAAKAPKPPKGRRKANKIKKDGTVREAEPPEELVPVEEEEGSAETGGEAENPHHLSPEELEAREEESYE